MIPPITKITNNQLCTVAAHCTNKLTYKIHDIIMLLREEKLMQFVWGRIHIAGRKLRKNNTCYVILNKYFALLGAGKQKQIAAHGHYNL